MTLGAAWTLLLLATSAPAGPVAAPADAGRTYEGPSAVESPSGVSDVDTVAQPGAPRGAAAVEPSGRARAATGETFVNDRRPEREEPHALPKPRPIPRILTTIFGWYPGEEAVVANKTKTFHFTPGVQLRNQVGNVSEFTLDRAGSEYTENAFLNGRLRWRPVFAFGRQQNLRLVGMLDLFSGRWAPRQGGTAPIRQILADGSPPQTYAIRWADPRELYVEWTSKVGLLRIGQQSFTWGQGLVANDGNNMDRFGDLKFGDDGYGSIQERIVFGTKPFARGGGPGKDIVVAIGADLVYRDANADLTKGDLAGQGFLVLRWEPSKRPGSWLGGYAVYRHQKSKDDGDVYPDDDRLEVGVLDFAGQGYRYLREDLAVIGAFEAVSILGRTTFPRGQFDRHRVLQAAAALRAYVGNPVSWLVGTDAGFASGDANPDDDEVNDFEAAPGFTAGLLMFQYYRGWQSARSQFLAEDPVLVGTPPNGTQYIPTKGSVTNALYLQPKARWSFRERFEVWGGPLIAASAVPLVDPYTTRLNGGAPTNSLGGRSDRRYLGTEIDLGMRVRYGFRGLWLMAGLQGGVMFPGGALAFADGDKDRPVWGVWFRTEIRY